MRITLFIRVLMMNAVSRYPENRSALKRQGRTHRQKIFHPFRSLVPPVREQTMIAHSNTQTSGDPPQESCNEQCFPAKEKQRRYCSYVKGSHKKGRDPVDLVIS